MSNVENSRPELWKPAEICEALGCDPDATGFDDFVELCHRIALKWVDSGAQRAVLARTVDEMCVARNTFPRAFYQKIKRAVKPVLEADDETLAALGIRLEKRTSSELAYCLAYILEKYRS